jgi:hypothetical protein
LGNGAGGLKVVSFNIRAVLVAPKPVAEG